MRVVKYECGCVGLRDSTTPDVIILKHCDQRIEDEWPITFRRPEAVEGYSRKNFEPLPGVDEGDWLYKILKLVYDGQRLREVQRIIKGGE